MRRVLTIAAATMMFVALNAVAALASLPLIPNWN